MSSSSRGAVPPAEVGGREFVDVRRQVEVGEVPVDAELRSIVMVPRFDHVLREATAPVRTVNWTGRRG